MEALLGNFRKRSGTSLPRGARQCDHARLFSVDANRPMHLSGDSRPREGPFFCGPGWIACEWEVVSEGRGAEGQRSERRDQRSGIRGQGSMGVSSIGVSPSPVPRCEGPGAPGRGAEIRDKREERREKREERREKRSEISDPGGFGCQMSMANIPRSSRTSIAPRRRMSRSAPQPSTPRTPRRWRNRDS